MWTNIIEFGTKTKEIAYVDYQATYKEEAMASNIWV